MAVKGLEFVVNLTDRVSSPLGKIGKSLDNLVSKTKNNMKNIAMGAAGLFAVGKSMQAALMPAIEMDRALGETASLGVADQTLDKLRKTALTLSVEFGKSAVDIVKSSYTIQQSFGRLNGDELVGLTKTTNILAAAIKTDANAATGYMSRMYQIFKKEADAMGKVKWAEKLSAQTAIAVQLFNVDANKLENAFKTVSGAAQLAGVSTAEQMAVIGQLQGKVGETKAAKQYEAFIRGAMDAQRQMGVSFLDSNGKLLSTDKILTIIKKRFGDIQKNKEAIKKAFGGDSAYKFIENLSDETEQLKNNIDKLNDTNGLKAVIAQAHKMTDPWERMEALFKAVSTSIGNALQPKLYPILNSITDIGLGFVEWLEKYRNIARWIGYLVSALMGFAAVGPVIMTLKGVFGLWWGSMTGAYKTIIALGKAMKLNILISKAWAVVMAVLNTAAKIGAVSFRMLWSAITGPIGLIIGAIALIGYVVYANWDKIKAFCVDLWDNIKTGWNNLTAWFYTTLNQLGQWFSSVWDSIIATWDDVTTSISLGWQIVVNFFEQLSPLKTFTQLGDKVQSIFSDIFSGLKNKFFQFINWFIEKANSVGQYIGIEIPTIKLDSTSEKVNKLTEVTSITNKAAPADTLSSALSNQQDTGLSLPSNVQPPKAPKQGFLSNKTSTVNNNNNSVNISTINVNSNNPQEFMQGLRDQRQIQ